MGRPLKDPNKVSVEKSQLDNIMDRLQAAETKTAMLEQKNTELEAKVAKGSKQGIETSAHRLLSKSQPAEQDPVEVRKSIQVVDKKATIDGKMIHDECPFCNKFSADLPNILDLTGANKYACRRCGKHWEQWALKPSPFTGKLYPYSEALEQGNKKRVEYAERIAMGQQGMAVGLVESEDN